MANRAVKAVLGVVIIVVVLVIGAAGYYFGKIVPLIKAGKKESNYSTAASRPSVTGFGFDTGKSNQTIADLKGKVVVVDVWATWCGPCIYSIPKVVALRDRYKDKPVEIIGLDVDNERWGKVNPFLQKHSEINYTIAVPSPAPNFLYQSLVDLPPLGEVAAIPTIFVIDQKGRLAAKFVEVGHEKEVDDLVNKLLTEPATS
ncbi:MAG TPA: TlpA disulfide reductase family protein [Blastocatellia bacterium]|nr:TlpA disulfide reductase family protein [Blastocatellia bacterium]